MLSDDLIAVDSDILGGTPVFKGTRVPVKTIFEYLEDNYSLAEFLECFPSVTPEIVLSRSGTFRISAARGFSGMKILLGVFNQAH
jgi:uncharacterized protein (DUF433 family)